MPTASGGNNISDSAQINPGVVSTSDLADQAVDTTKIKTEDIRSDDIKDGEIVNADISASAAIADTKLATISTAGKVSGAALTSLSSIPVGAGLIPAANVQANPPWVSEGTLSWSAESTDKTLTFTNAGKDLYMVVMQIVPNAGGTLSMRLNGVTGANYSYRTIAGTTTAQSTGQTSFEICQAMDSLIAVLYIGGKQGAGSTYYKNVVGNVLGLGGGSLREFERGALDSNNATLSTLTIMANSNTITGKVAVYSLSL